VPLHEQRVLIVGDGATRISVAETLATAMAQDARSMTTFARQRIFLADSAGLVTATSRHADRDHELMREVLLYAQDMPDVSDVEQARANAAAACH
jgi:malic enzyme